MAKKKKTAAKQTKPNLDKPSGKAGKDSAASKKSAPEVAAKKEVPAKAPKAKSEEAQPAEVKATKLETEAVRVDAPAAAEAPSDKAEPQSSKTSAAAKSEAKKKDEPKAASKSQAAKGKKKNKSEEVEEATEAEGTNALPEVAEAAPVQEVSSVEEVSASSEAVESAEEADGESFIEVETSERAEKLANVASGTDAPPAPERKVAKTIPDAETDFSPGLESSEGEKTEPRKVAKTMLEMNIGGLAEAASKATGTNLKAEAPQPTQTPERKVPKTLMEMNVPNTRGALESSAKEIEEQIAAELKGLEADEQPQSPQPQSQPPQSQPQAPKNPDRHVAKTMLDFRTDELTDLANLTGDEVETPADMEITLEPSVVAANLTPAAPPSPPDSQPRKVAKTMLEMDSPDLSKILAASQPEQAQAASPAPVQNAQPEPVSQQIAQPVADATSHGSDDVSIADLSEFAQALKENKPMSEPQTERLKRLHRTMLEIRRVGVSSAALPAVTAPSERLSGEEDVVKPAPVRISRSLHPLDNFSFDKLCPIDEDDIREAEAAQAAQSNNAANKTGTVEIPNAEGQQNFDASPETSFEPQGGWETSQASAHEYQSPDNSDGASDAGNRRTGTVEIPFDPHQESSEQPYTGTSTVWPSDEPQPTEEQAAGTVKPERFVARTMLDMDFLKDSLSASVAKAEERIAESIAAKASEPPKPTITQDDYKLAQPNCPFVWAEGDSPKERVKYCTQCSAQVYNFAGFDLAEAESLIFKRENREKATIYKRADGKFMTQDCPIALKKKNDRMMLVVGGILVLVLLAAMGVMMQTTPQPTAPPAPATGGTLTPDGTDTTFSTSTTGSEAGDSQTGTTTGTITSTSTEGKSGGDSVYHYKRGKVIQQPVKVTEPSNSEDANVPGTNSGFDEGGQFWQFQDKGNN